MKVEFANRSEKLLIIAIITVVAFIAITAFQSMSNKHLRKEIKENKQLVKELELQNEDLQYQIAVTEEEKELITKKIDSVEKSETYFKNKYYSTNEKLKNIIGNYSGSSDATKNELFSNAVNN